ncbi:MAG: cytochrome c3 family protein [Candidatus Aminicenantes bacterium]|nr:cytochrome c3 family protein [Candidatus Aminicenantes bacterium]
MRMVSTSAKLACWFALVLLLSCSPSVLRVFFDGVPDPAEEIQKEERPVLIQRKPGVTSTAVKEPGTGMKSRHEDYVQKRCSNCHNVSSPTYLKEEKRKLCFTCHKEEEYTGPFVHGPVAVGTCTGCHLPHQSQYESLLKNTGRALCMSCHREDQIQSEVHEIGSIEDCSSCHLPHVSDNRYFIRQKQE